MEVVKYLVDIDFVFSRYFEEVARELLCLDIALVSAHHSLTVQVALIPNQHHRYLM